MPEGWRKWLTLIGIWLYDGRLDAPGKSVKQYYEALDRPGLIKDLVNSLEARMGSQTQLRSIFEDHAASDKDGEPYWEEENFIK
ncbi:hypothetical protein SPBR_04519 [Sporothrix brasiliensis 5110]|uniref:Uncharacterized protein n=1 Tax=Sporothrix brasiliensis 5110 TaxID=1398154 RepID=A0A0C2J8M8_9PEZI|nr:uncharacterized protein SPBR_04519 [Sporothrix brasiliensis 5110]KIH93337.1 hypothetical protein SPBR_04519 [Sporothrix brasiliensis 5110]